ncbi:hypothetical protein NBRC116601_18530 [Cognatishimia sp. WU-CL00825]
MGTKGGWGLALMRRKQVDQMTAVRTKLLLPKAIRMSAMTADILMFNTKAFPQKSAK